MKDLNQIAQIEKAIQQKYGDRAVINPKSLWSKEDEENYQQQISSGSFETQKKTIKEKREDYDFECSKLFTEEERVCEKCGVYSMNNKDSLYLNKFHLCYTCFLKHEINLRWTGKI